MPVRRVTFLLVYFAAWVPVAVAYGFLIYLQRNSTELAGSLLGGAQSVLYAALLGLFVWRWTERLADRPRPAARLAAVHLGIGALYTGTWATMVLLSIAVFAPRDVLDVYLQYAFGWSLLTGLFLYGMVAGIAHAVTVGRRLRRERDALVRAEALRAQAELNAVRAQMHPHFLFNTLHSIAAVVRSDPDAAERALERLAILLRRLLDVTRLSVDRVSLGEEWEIVQAQLALEQLRFGDRLVVRTSVEPDALDCMIPVLTLQPLVENAVRHGVAARAAATSVYVAATVAKDVLTIEVRDDGPGAERGAAMSASGLGLRGTKQRLQAAYGDRGGLHVDTAPGAGFRVVMTLPATSVPLPTTAERAAAAHAVVGG